MAAYRAKSLLAPSTRGSHNGSRAKRHSPDLTVFAADCTEAESKAREDWRCPVRFQVERLIDFGVAELVRPEGR